MIPKYWDEMIEKNCPNQSTNTKVWKEWLPGNSEYELSGQYNIEWYSPEGEPGPKQKCRFWFPIKKK